MKRPKVTVRKSRPDDCETNVEFTFPSGEGGLACFRMRKGIPVVEFYRIDDGVRVDVHPKHVTYDGEQTFG